MKKLKENEKLISVEELCEKLSLKRSCVIRLTWEGVIPAFINDRHCKKYYLSDVLKAFEIREGLKSRKKISDRQTIVI